MPNEHWNSVANASLADVHAKIALFWFLNRIIDAFDDYLLVEWG